MGWAYCGTDSRGRDIGYGIRATCDHPGCSAEIDRGLGYACGGMHGDSGGCEKYFCPEHLYFLPLEDEEYELFDRLWGADCNGIVCATCCEEIVEAVNVQHALGDPPITGDDEETP